jgi:hypothetical protein
MASVCTITADRQPQLSYFFTHYDEAFSSASAFDDKVRSDAMAAGGQDYLSLTSLAARQAFGAIEYTNTPTEPWLFMKEISSDGNVNTVDGKSLDICSCHQIFSPSRHWQPWLLQNKRLEGLFAAVNDKYKLTATSHIPVPSDRHLHERQLAQIPSRSIIHQPRSWPLASHVRNA